MTYSAPSVSLGVVLKAYIGKWVIFGIYIYGKVHHEKCIFGMGKYTSREMYILDGEIDFTRTGCLVLESFMGWEKYASVELRIWKGKVYFRRTS